MAELNVIYPKDSKFEPSVEVLAQLSRINGENGRGLAELLGFGQYPGTSSQIMEGESEWVGMGDREEDVLHVAHFCIFISGASRPEENSDGWTQYAEQEGMKKLSEFVGTELAQKPFIW